MIFKPAVLLSGGNSLRVCGGFWMRYLLRLVVFLLVVSSAGVAAQTIVNAGFEEAEGRWGDRDGPAGWTLRLKASDDECCVVESDDLVKEVLRAFRFTEVARGFGDSRLEQCVPLGELSALQLSAQVRVEEPDPELAVRLRVDFYADDDCETESAAAGEEQIETSIGLRDRKSTRLNSSHVAISYAVFCLKKKKQETSVRI